MNCPTCNVSLVMSDKQGIEIDYCPQCRGIWLDRGELDKIIERTIQNDNQFSAPPPRHSPNAPYSHGYQKPYKQKHWLQDLFD